MTADPLPLTELLDQLERLVDGLVLETLADGVLVSLDDRPLIESYPDEQFITDNATPAAVRRAFAAVNLLRPMVEALRAANKVDEREADGHADQGDGFCDACEAPLPCSYADLSARLAALRDAAALELEEKSRG